MPDLDPYSSNGGGEHRPELRSAMPFFPSPPSAPSSASASPAGGAGGATGTLPAPPPLRGEVLPGGGSTSTGPLPAASPAVSSTGPVAPVTPPAPPSVPESAPPPASAGGRASVKGQIHIEDEVVEKIAALAALEVSGVAALGGRREASETMEEVRRRIGGDARAESGVRALVSGDEITLEVSLVVEYGSVVFDVARTVKNNVARSVGKMLGMKVASVDVTVADVRMPGAAG